MKNKTETVGIIILGTNMDDEILMVKNDGLYSLPEILTENSECNNIVDIGHDLAKKLNIKVNDLSLAYVIEQSVSETAVTVKYYFVGVTDTTEPPKGYEWVSKSYEKISNSLYPQKFIDSLKKKFTEGWLVITEIIK